MWPETTRLNSGFRPATIGTIGPEKLLQSDAPGTGTPWDALCWPPWCTSSTCALTPNSFSRLPHLLAVATSFSKRTFLIPAGLTMPGVPSRVRPTKPTGTPPMNLMSIGGRIGRPVFLLIVLAAR
nr:hypothetical protein GCM10020092_098340 [Actinoplanes digitatis]